jgi:hypothetical protein
MQTVLPDGTNEEEGSLQRQDSNFLLRWHSSHQSTQKKSFSPFPIHSGPLKVIFFTIPCVSCSYDATVPKEGFYSYISCLLFLLAWAVLCVLSPSCQCEWPWPLSVQPDYIT